MDWKMNFYPQSSRDTSLEHFGKKGISWHGFLIQFFVYEEVTNEDGSVECFAHPKNLYVDQVMSGSSKQSAANTTSMLEALMWQLDGALTDIEEIVLQSDNASNYQGNTLLFSIPLMNCIHRIKIVRYILTETQDGKGLIDAHFAHGTIHVTIYLKTATSNRVSRVATPAGLARAIAFNGGIQNSFVQLVRPDESRLAILVDRVKNMDKMAKQRFARCSDIFFPKPQRGWSSEEDLRTREGLQAHTGAYFVKLYAFSGIGNGVDFIIDFGSDKFNQVDMGHLTPGVVQLENGDLENNVDEVELRDEDLGDEVITERQDNGNQEDGSLSESDEDGENDPELHETIAAQADDADQWDDTATYNQRYVAVDQMMVKQTMTGVHVLRSSGFGDQVPLLRTSVKKKAKKRKRVEVHDPNAQVTKRDLFTYAVTRAKDLMLSSSTFRNGQDTMPEYDDAATFTGVKPKERGWGRRAPRGTAYGTNYIANYKGDIKEFFEIGRADSTKQMNSSVMLEELMRRYPGRYTLPGEIDIRREINSLFQSQKKEEAKAKRDGRYKATTERYAMPSKYVDEIKAQLILDPNVKPAQVLSHLRNQFASNGALTEDFPPDEKIKQKVSSLKTSAKANDLKVDELH
jgi:hypothetical protein